MDSARWKQVQVLFAAAVEQPPAEREGYLREACAGDGALLSEVLSLLAEDERSESLLDRRVGDVADDFLGSSGRGEPPATIGPYHLRGVLGEGGMGVVYLAERPDLGSRAAVKLLRDAWLSPARRERFAAEQRTLAQLLHPSIAQLLDAGALPDGTPWLVMEYVEGVPLTRYCAEHGTTIEGRLELFRAACEAVQYAHGQAVIHRDLKPSNILVKPDGTVKLLDFGIAKHLESLDEGSDQTVTALRVMTPAYAAPEQVLGGRLGIHTDIYALGVLLFELLTERLPAERRPGLRLKDASPRERPSHATSRQLRARSASRASWADLDVLCMNAMHEDPERRYPTVEALVRDIDHYLAHQPLEARPDALGYRLGKFLARNRAAVLVAGAAFVFALGLAVFYTARLAAARDAAQVEAARAQRIQAFMLDLFEGGDDAAGPAEDLRVLSLLERGVEEASALGEEPEVQAELERTLGGLFQKLGKFERAEALLAGALRQQRELHGEGAPSTADTSVVLGLLRLEQARFEEAEELVRDGLGALRARLPAEHPSVVRATSALGQVLEARGDYDGAIAINEEVARLYAASGDGGAEHTAALGQLADSHYYAGHYELADAINERVLAAVRAIHGEGHPRVADVMINLGASQSDRGRYPEAEAFYRQALDILEAFHGADHFRTASAKTMLGRTLVYQGRTAEGIPLLQDALAIQEAVHGSEHPRVASALNDLGSAALQEGRLDEAEECFLRMLEVYRHVYPEGHYLEGIAISNLGSVTVERADHVAAEHLYREALAIYESRLSPAHLNTGIGRIKLGRALLRQSRFAEAEVESRAGYEIVQAQSSPSVSWLRSARADLVAAYEALGEPERAQVFREAEQP